LLSDRCYAPAVTFATTKFPSHFDHNQISKPKFKTKPANRPADRERKSRTTTTMMTTAKTTKTTTMNFCTSLITSIWPGLGLLGESYLLFSLGTLQPLLATVGVVPVVVPLILGVICGMVGFGVAGSTSRFLGRRWGSISTAAFMWMGSIGMFVTSLVVGHGDDDRADVVTNALFGTSLCILGLGVGGEYPMAAASASERQQQEPQQHHGHHNGHGHPHNNGQQVQLVFSMQGMGILLHCILLWTLLLIFGENEPASLLLVWRILYFVGVLLLGTVLTTRVLLLQESPVWEADQKRAAAVVAEMVELGGRKQPANDKDKQNQRPDDNNTNLAHGNSCVPTPKTTADEMAPAPYPLVPTVSSLSMPSVGVSHDGAAVYHIHTEQVKHSIPVSSSAKGDHAVVAVGVPHSHQWRLAWKLYGARLVGVSLTWYFWDVAFYGNKLFQSAFLLAITGDETTTLTQGAAAATLNAAVAAAGYLTAAVVMDRIGHWRLQLFGLLLTGLLFLSTGFFLDKFVDQAKAGLVILYLGTSYFGQVGPNATTFVLPAEVMPTAWRTLGHGLAAASGKLGALSATLLFHNNGNHYINDDNDGNNNTAANLFLWSGYASLLGAVITYWLVPFETATPTGGTTTAHDGNNDTIQLQPQQHDYSSSSLDTNWHRAAAGQPYIVPADSVYERLLAQRRKVEADGHYLASDFHDAVYG
jgi:MFS family permease